MAREEESQDLENEPAQMPVSGQRQPSGKGLLRKSWDRLTTGAWPALGWLGLTIGALVAMGQIGSIVQEVSRTGQYPVSAVLGIGKLLSFGPARQALSAWDEAAVHLDPLGGWLWWYLGIDALFIIGLCIVGITVLKGRSHARTDRWILAIVIAACALEAAIAAITLSLTEPSAGGTGVPAPWPWLLYFATAVKWLALLTLLAWSVWRVLRSRRGFQTSSTCRDERRGIYADLRRLVLALEVQRFSLVVVLLLGLLATGPPVPGLSDTLKQMPDVQLAWIGSAAGVRQMLVAGLAQVLLAGMLLLLGRMRTRRAIEKFAGDRKDHRKASLLWMWLVPPVVVAVLATSLRLSGLATVAWARVIAFCAVLTVIAGSSVVVELSERRRIRLGRARRVGELGRDLPSHHEWRAASAARLAGDALSVAVICVAALGLIRSFTVAALIESDPAWPLILAVAGFLTVVVLPLGWNVLGARIPGLKPPKVMAARTEPAKENADPERHARRRIHISIWALGSVFIGADALLIFLPLATTHVLGVLGTAVVAIGSLASLFSALAYLVQSRRPLPIFRLLKMNVTPVMTIVLLIAIVDGLADRNSTLHQVRPPVSRPAEQGRFRPTLSTQFAAWLRQVPASCGLATLETDDLGRPIRVQPLIELAASGGGIRAAWWTVRVLGRLVDTACGAQDIFAISSVSGGSLGVAVLATARQKRGDLVRTAEASLVRLAGPDALAAAIDGLMLRDAIAGYTGIDLRAAQMPENARYPDRAALIEARWQDEDARLRVAFPIRHSSVPWATLFNSTSVTTGCRAVLSSFSLPHVMPEAPQGVSCALGGTGPAGGYDFFAQLRCMRNIASSTAALLSARFPYVTPSGTITNCGASVKHGIHRKFIDQLVDGGYGDSTGLSTLANLAPALMSLVRGHNEKAIARRGDAPVTLLVPVTVYLGNSVEPAQAIRPAARQPEFNVPPHGHSVGPATELTSRDVLLQDILAATGPRVWLPCQHAGPACTGNPVADRIPDQLMVVAPREYPQVAAPLGWLLSPASQRAMNRSLRRDIRSKPCQRLPDRETSRRYRSAHPYCLPGVGGMADLLALVEPGG